jgi:hypothetical protein
MMTFLNRPRFQLLAALVLVLAQALLLAHASEVDAHADEESCETCISFKQLGHASLPVAVGPTLPASRRVANTPGMLPPITGPDVYPTPPCRAPPDLLQATLLS